MFKEIRQDPSKINKLPIGRVGPITGEDDRYSPADIAAPPYSSICHLRVIPGGETQREFFGTGFLVHPNLILTSAYHVHSIDRTKNALGDAKEVQVFIGLSHKKREGGAGQFTDRIMVSDPANYRVPQQWKDGDRRFNFAGILLKRNTKSSVADAIALTKCEVPLEKSQEAFITSYPRDAKTFPEIWESRGDVFLLKNGRLHYEIDTGDASSGSPIWYWGKNKSPTAIGIHLSFGTVRGIPFDDENLEIINKWIEEAERLY